MGLETLGAIALSASINFVTRLLTPAVKNKAPELNLRVPRSSYGSAIPLMIGKCRLEGNKIFPDNVDAMYDTETRTESQGGKGGGVETERNIVYATFLVLFGQGQNTLEKIIVNGKEYLPTDEWFTEYCTYFDGTQTNVWSEIQNRSEAPFNQIAYKDVSSLGFARLPVEEYGNQIPQQISMVGYLTELGERPDLASVITFICGRAGISASELDVSELVGTPLVEGFILQETGEGYRKAIEELLQFYLLTAFEARNGLITFKALNRGDEPAIVLQDDDYIIENNSGLTFTKKEEEVQSLPSKFTVKFNSLLKNYDQDEVVTHFNNGSKKNSLDISFNLNTYPDLVQERSLLLLRYLILTQRYTYTFKLAPHVFERYPTLDLLSTIELKNGDRVQVQQISYNNEFSVDVTAKIYVADLDYSYESAVQEEPEGNRFVDPPIPDVYALDIAKWSNSDPYNVIYLFATGVCRIQVGAANGFYKTTVEHLKTSTIGTVQTELTEVFEETAFSGDTIDITLDTGSVESVGFYNNNAFIAQRINLALIGHQEQGSWTGELIQFGTVTVLENNRYRLSQITRGLFGTYNVSDHEQYSNERFFLLNDAVDIAYYSILSGGYQWTNYPLRLRAIVKPWQDIANTPEVNFTPAGNAFKAPAVTDFASEQDELGSIRFTWEFSVNTQSLQLTGLENPTYEIDIIQSSNVIRTLTTTNKEVIYTQGDRTNDNITFPFEARIYVVNSITGRGFPASLTIAENLTPESTVFIPNDNPTGTAGIKGKRFIDGTTDVNNPVTYVVQESDNNRLLIIRNATAEAYTNLQFSATLPIGFQVYVLNSPTNPIVARGKILVPTFLPIPYLSDINQGVTAIVTHIGNGEYSSIANYAPIVYQGSNAIGVFKNPRFTSSDSSINLNVSDFDAETTLINLTATGTAFTRRTIQDDGVDVPDRGKLSFVNALLTDDPTNDRTVIQLDNTVIRTKIFNVIVPANSAVTVDVANFPRKGTIYKLTSDFPIRARLYFNSTFRASDISREFGDRLDYSVRVYYGLYFEGFTDPSPINTSIVEPADFFTGDNTGYFTINNLSSTNSITTDITITYG